MKGSSARYHGVNACFALANARFDDIERAYVTEEGLTIARTLLGALADAKKLYRVVPPEEMEKVSGTTHHEGICLVAKARPEIRFEDVLARTGPSLVVGLPGVQNPHNLGAILRVAAHFGVDAVLVDEAAPRIAGAVARSAEGGAEHVEVARVRDFARALHALNDAGFLALATSSHATASLWEVPKRPRTLVLFGAEDHGLDRALLERSTRAVAIPGTGAVESLNVATAAAVCLAALTRPR